MRAIIQRVKAAEVIVDGNLVKSFYLYLLSVFCAIC